MESLKIDPSKFKRKKPDKNLHSDLHLVTNEVWEFCGKDKPFGFYLGMIKRIGTNRARYILGNLKDRLTPAKEPGKMFVWMVRNNK